MLSSFLIRNFRSILELKLDFAYGEGKAPPRHQEQEIMPFLEGTKKQRLVPCMAFFGANASGKSNILKALGTIKFFMSADQAPTLAYIFDPNRLNPKFEDTTLEPTFVCDGDDYVYSLTYSAHSIKEESLVRNGKLVFSIKNMEASFSAEVLSPTYTHEKLSEIMKVECSDGENRQTEPFLRRIGRSYPGLNPATKAAFSFLAFKLNYHENQQSLPFPISVDILSKALNGNKTEAMLEIAETLRKFDVTIHGIDIAQTSIGETDPIQSNVLLQIDKHTGARHTLHTISKHKDISGNIAVFDFIKHESTGTQHLAGLIGLILYTLKTGGLLVVDELECSLHPLIVREIVLLFKARRHNPKNAQLIFNTHNSDILDDSILRISEIALLRKNLVNGTICRRLTDLRKDGADVRNVTNFRKQYLSGLYSGIPYPAL
jgi:AAA15 family ATPase/GTPase